MNPVIASAEVPRESEIHRRLGGACFHDCYVAPVQSEGASALELYLGVVSQTPPWVNFLMAVRNRVVGLFDADKHLNVQVSVRKAGHGGGGIAVSTVVHIHNMLGRIYMLPVAPVHKVIVQAMLRRVVAAQHVA